MKRRIQWIEDSGRLGDWGRLGQDSARLERDHLYRGRYLVPQPPIVGCAGIPTDPIRDSLLGLASFRFPADLFLAVDPTSLDVPPLSTPPWPSDRRDYSGRSATECLVWFQGRASGDADLDLGTLSQALAPLGGRIVDFWDQTTGQGIIGPGTQVPACPIGEHADPVTGQCVPDVSPCAAGSHRDPATGACVPDVPVGTCAPGTHRDPATGLCVPDVPVPSPCGPGTHLDPTTRRCVPDALPPPATRPKKSEGVSPLVWVPLVATGVSLLVSIFRKK